MGCERKTGEWRLKSFSFSYPITWHSRPVDIKLLIPLCKQTGESFCILSKTECAYQCKPRGGGGGGVSAGKGWGFDKF